MTKAFRCDSCDEFCQGDPSVTAEFNSPDRPGVVDLDLDEEPVADLCLGCWRSVIDQLGFKRAPIEESDA